MIFSLCHWKKECISKHRISSADIKIQRIRRTAYLCTLLFRLSEAEQRRFWNHQPAKGGNCYEALSTDENLLVFAEFYCYFNGTDR